jgi:uncharacterized protein DUF4145
MPKKKVTKSHCNTCARTNNHTVLVVKNIYGGTYDEGYGDIGWTNSYELLECNGCESISFRHTYWFEPTDERDVTIYPPPTRRHPPLWQINLPSDVQQLLREVYSALAAESRSLAMMGARALVDMVLLKNVGDLGSFAEKLAAAEKAGLIGRKNRDILATALDAGSAAAHRGYRASSFDVGAVMDIVENLLQAIYHLGSLADVLKKNTPPRSAKP